jgi:hypothetical protein
MSTKSKKRKTRRATAKKANRGFVKRAKRRVVKLAKVGLKAGGGVLKFGSPEWRAVYNASTVTKRKGRKRTVRHASYV